MFLHGYNVNQQEARGVLSEVFKRMYWSRSKAKFYGVTWNGAVTKNLTSYLPLEWQFTPDYHTNVVNALLYIGTNCWHLLEGAPPLLVTDPQESRAMVSRSRTWSIGVQRPAPGQTGQGIIESTVELNAQFGFAHTKDEHSAQWTRPIQMSWGYYDQVLESCLIPTIQR